jgi:hypothetical protein
MLVEVELLADTCLCEQTQARNGDAWSMYIDGDILIPQAVILAVDNTTARLSFVPANG